MERRVSWAFLPFFDMNILRLAREVKPREGSGMLKGHVPSTPPRYIEFGKVLRESLMSCRSSSSKHDPCSRKKAFLPLSLYRGVICNLIPKCNKIIGIHVVLIFGVADARLDDVSIAADVEWSQEKMPSSRDSHAPWWWHVFKCMLCYGGGEAAKSGVSDAPVGRPRSMPSSSPVDRRPPALALPLAAACLPLFSPFFSLPIKMKRSQFGQLSFVSRLSITCSPSSSAHND